MTRTRRRPRQDDSAVDDANPMIDLLFVLVMSLALMAHPEALERASVPQVGGGGGAERPPESPIVAINAEGNLALNGNPITEPDLLVRLGEMTAGDAATLRLQASPELPHGTVVRIRQVLCEYAKVFEDLDVKPSS